MTRILIVDDHHVFREGLVSIFRRQSDFEIVGEAASVAEAIEAAIKIQPELILMDFNLPDGTGLDATKAILGQYPKINIIFLTINEDDEKLLAAIRSGAKGYLLKNIGIPDLLASLRGLERGEAALSRKMVSRLLDAVSDQDKPEKHPISGLNQLTSREYEILHEIARGASNREIAARFVISENTVKNHVHNILEKLKLKSRREVALYISQQGGKRL